MSVQILSSQDLPQSHEPAIGETPIMHAIGGFGKEAKTTSAWLPCATTMHEKGKKRAKWFFDAHSA